MPKMRTKVVTSRTVGEVGGGGGPDLMRFTGPITPLYV